MTVPTITTVTPSAGPTGGRTLIHVVGTGFRLPDPPPSTGVVPVPGPTVRVDIDGTRAR